MHSGDRKRGKKRFAWDTILNRAILTGFDCLVKYFSQFVFTQLAQGYSQNRELILDNEGQGILWFGTKAATRLGQIGITRPQHESNQQVVDDR
jgi:hypothetical protein